MRTMFESYLIEEYQIEASGLDVQEFDYYYREFIKKYNLE